MSFFIQDLFDAQKKLDDTIASNHNITYSSTREKRIMALLVEIGELANATRCFKFWSNKASESNEVVLDEYADGLHFFLSLGNDILTSKKVYDFTDIKKDPVMAFHEVYYKIEKFHEVQDDTHYIDAFQSFWNLLVSLGYTYQDAYDAYFKKLGENYHRQQTNY